MAKSTRAARPTPLAIRATPRRLRVRARRAVSRGGHTMKVRYRALGWLAAAPFLFVAAAIPVSQSSPAAPYADARVGTDVARYADSIHKAEALLHTYMADHGIPGL